MATCAKGQDCALQCACGDKACSLKCAASNPSAKALPVAMCVNTNCGSSLRADGVDCSKSACQTECKCALDKCGSQIDACLADATCAKGQDCALQCACGDKVCQLKCAAQNPSAKALPVATCITKNCASSLKADAVDCSKSACPKDCECALNKCGSQIDACLADATCAKGQDCALACACGDKVCQLKCAAQNPSAKALPVATCITKNCASSLKADAVDCS